MDTPTVHVIDDELSVRRALIRLLRAHGYQVHAYASAEEFLAGTENHTHACAIVDLRMPGKSGLDLLREIGARGGSLPVILITGHGDRPAVARAMAAGASHVLLKPFDQRSLLAAITQALATGPQVDITAPRSTTS